jgi:hypothetical protein
MRTLENCKKKSVPRCYVSSDPYSLYDYILTLFIASLRSVGPVRMDGWLRLSHSWLASQYLCGDDCKAYRRRLAHGTAAFKMSCICPRGWSLISAFSILAGLGSHGDISSRQFIGCTLGLLLKISPKVLSEMLANPPR